MVWAFAYPVIMDGMRDSVVSMIGKRSGSFTGDMGLTVAYGSASPRIFGSIRFDSVEIGGGERVSARAASIELRYDVKAALVGVFKLRGLRMEDLELAGSGKEVQDLIQRIVDRFIVGGEPPTGLVVELRRALVRLDIDGDLSVDARIKAADLVVLEGGTLGVSVAGTAGASDRIGRWGLSRLEAPFSGSASIRLKPFGLEAGATLSADSDLGKLLGTRLVFSIDGEKARLSVAPGKGLRKLEAVWDFGDDELSLEAGFDGWSPRTLFEPRGSLAWLSTWFGTSVAGSLSARSDLTAEGTELAVDAVGTVPADKDGSHPRFYVAAKGSWNGIDVRRVSFENDLMSAAFVGALSPARKSARGTLDFSYNVTPSLSTSSRFEISGAGASWFAYAPSLRIGDAVLRDGIVSLDFSDGSASFYIDAAMPYTPSSTPSPHSADKVGVEPGMVEASSESLAPRLVVEGLAAFGDKPFLEAVVKLDSTSMREFDDTLDALLGVPASNLLAPLSLGGDVSVYSDYKTVSFNSSGMLVVYDGLIDGFGVLSLSGGRGRLDIRSIDATIAGYTVQGSASANYGSGEGVGFEADIKLRDIPYRLSGAAIDGAVIISGDYGLRFMARTEKGELAVAATVLEMPLPFLGAVSFLSASTTARYVSAEDWSLVVEQLSLSQPPGTILPLPAIDIAGSFDQSGGRFSRLGFRDKTSSLEGTMDVTWSLRDGFQVKADGKVSGTGGESYALNGEYRSDGYIDAKVSLQKATLARLAIPALRGSIDVNARLTGSVDSPLADFTFAMNSGQRAEGLPVVSGSGSYREGTVLLSDTRLLLGQQKFDKLSLTYSVADAVMELSSEMELRIGKNLFAGTVKASGTSNAPHGTKASALFEDYALAGNLESVSWQGSHLDDIPFQAKSRGKNVDISLGPLGELYIGLKSAGDLSIRLAPGLPLSFDAGGRISDGSISLDVRNASVDMPFLFDLIGLPIVRADSGTASGDIKIRGKLKDPTVEGVVEFKNLYMSVPDYVAAPIGPFVEPLYFNGRTMETLQPNLSCADASVVLSLESTLNGGIPDDIRLSVKTNDDGNVPVSTRLLGLEVKGVAKPDLQIEANRDRSKINGSIFLSAGDVVITTGVVRTASVEPWDNDFSGSLDLSFGKGVKAYFPNKKLPIIYGLTDPSSRLVVTFDMAKGDYNIKGATVLRGGSVFYIQRNFYLKSATIEFDEDAGQFDPKINAEAETRSSSRTGNVIVTLRARDSRMSDLSFSLSSVPAMSETDITAMLASNLLGGVDDGEVDPWRVIVENSDLIPQLDVASILERNLQTLLGLDMFVVKSLIFQRWLYDLSYSSNTSGQMTLAEYLEDTEIMAGKYLGDKLFLQGTLALVADPLASGTSLRLDSSVSLEWEAPHFILQWKLQPDNLDSLFIVDQSFSFLWRIPLK